MNMILKIKAGVIMVAAAIIITAAVCTIFTAETCFAAEEKPRLIAHGGGFIKGYDTTNSVEAVIQSIEDGYEFIELDFDLSEDDKIIMIHDWDRTVRHYFGTSFDRKLSEKEFEKMLINGRFTTLTFQRLTKILDMFPQIRIVTDVKGDNEAILGMIARDYPKYVKRLVPQIYNYEQYDAVKAMGYDEIILTLYAMPTIDYDELLRFIKTHDLYAVTVGSEHEHIIKDLKYKLAKDGVTVYYHPVKDFETAARAMDKGVYGVYANRVMPADFEEPARSYYLLDDKAKLCELSLEQKSFKALKSVNIKNGANKERTYFIDGEKADDEIVENLAEGRHDLKLILSKDGTTIAELEYFLWAGDSFLRLWDKRYEYRADEFKNPAEINALNDVETVSDEVRQLLFDSLVVKAGEYYGYCGGDLLIFRVGDEFLYTQRYVNGAVISPLSDCIKAVGAENITMDASRYVYVYYGGKRTMMQANTSFLSNSFKGNSMRTPLVLYRNKTMASGEVYKSITGRDYIDNQEILVLLPENVKIEDVSAEKADEIFEAAAWLFERTE